jgi:lipoyl-dependent peroxiredoxin
VPRNKELMNRKASAVWEGDLKSGHGRVSTGSGVLRDTQYSFTTRFENGAGTNPEELIAAAHAGCFSMALSAELGKAGLTPKRIETAADLTLDKTDAGWTVTKIHLTTRVSIPSGDRSKFDAAANAAKAGCPISRLLKCEITLDATLDLNA